MTYIIRKFDNTSQGYLEDLFTEIQKIIIVFSAIVKLRIILCLILTCVISAFAMVNYVWYVVIPIAVSISVYIVIMEFTLLYIISIIAIIPINIQINSVKYNQGKV